jgi:hypothetical protein
LNWQLFDDFSLKEDTYDGNIGYLQTGQAWDVRGSFTNGVLPPTTHGQIRGGALVSDNMSTVYATQSPPFVPAQMYAMISWLPGNTAGAMAGSITLATCLKDTFVLDMGAHLTVMPDAWYYWVRDTNGFDIVASGKIFPVCKIDGTQYPMGYSIIGNNVKIEVCGKKYSYSNNRISPNLGLHCFWEVFYYNKKETSAYSRINKIWGSPAEAYCTEGSLIVI